MSNIVLRGYQKAAVKAVIDEINNGAKRPFLVVEPCGSGKSYEIAGFIDALSADNPEFRMLVIAPSAELVAQDYNAITNIIGKKDVGIDSRMIGSQEINKKVVVTNINTIYKDYRLFGKVDIIIIDEAHQIRQYDTKNASMYRAVEAYFRQLKPNLCIIGLTATPHRLSEGLIYGVDKFFSHIVHETKLRTLTIGGFLSPLYCHLPNFTTDFTHAKTNFIGEFANDAWKLIDMDEAIEFLLKRAKNKRKVLIFASTLDQAELIKDKLEQATNKYIGLVTSDTPTIERKEILDRFCDLTGEDRIKYLVNVMVLKQGFDNPAIDMVVLFRPTKSTALYVQMCCRGSRKSPATRKTKCEILDFGGNVERHGFIDDIEYSVDGTGPREFTHSYRRCPECGALNSPKAEYCGECGHMFTHTPRKIDTVFQVNTRFNILSDQCNLNNYAVDEYDNNGKLLNTYANIPDAARLSGEQVENIMFALDLIKQYPGVNKPVNQWFFSIKNGQHINNPVI